MNKKRILASLVALLLLLSATACLVPNENAANTANPTESTVAQTTAVPSDEQTASGTFDGDAIAVKLGDITITANEVANVFDSYISMFSYSGSIDEEIVAQCLEMVEDELVRYYLPLWKANELGIALSDEETAEIEAMTRDDLEEERNSLLCQFAYYYGATEDVLEDASMLTEEALNVAIDGINEQLAQMFNEDFVFEDYLEMEYDSLFEGYQIDKLTDMLKASTADAPLDGEAVDTWYAKTLAEQQTRYAETPSEYYYDVLEYESGYSETPVLCAPAGYARVYVVELVPEGDPDPAIQENRSKLSDLEAEYGALLLNGGEDESRKAEIETEYAALKAENEALEAAYYDAVRESCEAAYARLLGGESFEAVMDAYNTHAEGESGLDERLVYTLDKDTRNGEIADVAKTLEIGAYSEPMAVDGAYVIVKLMEEIPEGPVDRAQIEDSIQSAARTALTEEAWDAQFDAWLAEAKELAVFFRDTYQMIGDMYINNY